jgi:hypothetical protein
MHHNKNKVNGFDSLFCKHNLNYPATKCQFTENCIYEAKLPKYYSCLHKKKAR